LAKKRSGKTNYLSAAEDNLLQGLTISVECDENAVESRRKLEELLGPATLWVASGGTWVNPDTGESEPKLHGHWVLAAPTNSKEEHAALKRLRSLICDYVGADYTGKPIVHPFRWPGSWHTKNANAPRLVRIVAESDSEIELYATLQRVERELGTKAKAEGKEQRNGRKPDKLTGTTLSLLTHPDKGPKAKVGAFKDRSAAMFGFIRMALNERLDEDGIVTEILDDEYKDCAIYEHIIFNGGETYIRGQIKRVQGEKEEKPKLPPPPKRTLDEVHAVFRKWFGDEYDLDAIDATAAAAASEQLAGDPLWLLNVSGPGAAKTETVQSLAGADAHVTSTISSEGALLSASPKRSIAKTATGGLLRKIGERGVLVIKDVGSILSAARETRGAVLAAIREIYDGRWERNVGTDGGQTLTWIGRIVIVGAVTTAWDTAHAVIASLGDRFVLIRTDSTVGRVQSGQRAIRNTGSETTMRQELADAVGGLIANASTDEIAIPEEEITKLIEVGDLVTLARTAVERDYKGEVINSHAPEMPTRFAKQLAQLVRGGVAIGMSREEALRLALRCARDSMPPLRLGILFDITDYPRSRPNDLSKRLGKPWVTIKREMQALTMLGLLLEEQEEIETSEGTKKSVWYYALARDEDKTTLRRMNYGEAAF
jgi:hypothetical protein